MATNAEATSSAPFSFPGGLHSFDAEEVGPVRVCSEKAGDSYCDTFEETWTSKPYDRYGKEITKCGFGHYVGTSREVTVDGICLLKLNRRLFNRFCPGIRSESVWSNPALHVQRPQCPHLRAAGAAASTPACGTLSFCFACPRIWRECLYEYTCMMTYRERRGDTFR